MLNGNKRLKVCSNNEYLKKDHGIKFYKTVGQSENGKCFFG